MTGKILVCSSHRHANRGLKYRLESMHVSKFLWSGENVDHQPVKRLLKTIPLRRASELFFTEALVVVERQKLFCKSFFRIPLSLFLNTASLCHYLSREDPREKHSFMFLSRDDSSTAVVRSHNQRFNISDACGTPGRRRPPQEEARQLSMRHGNSFLSFSSKCFLTSWRFQHPLSVPNLLCPTVLAKATGPNSGEEDDSFNTTYLLLWCDATFTH